jgi:CRISPR/Cas system CSM-associated protein Csm3 (group 7 of RAMP superfamily)
MHKSGLTDFTLYLITVNRTFRWRKKIRTMGDVKQEENKSAHTQKENVHKHGMNKNSTKDDASLFVGGVDG